MKHNLLFQNQTRRRTPGGVFLFLVRHDKDITYQQQHSIFDEERSKNKQKSKMKMREKYKKIKEKIGKYINSEFIFDLTTII